MVLMRITLKLNGHQRVRQMITFSTGNTLCFVNKFDLIWFEFPRHSDRVGVERKCGHDSSNHSKPNPDVASNDEVQQHLHRLQRVSQGKINCLYQIEIYFFLYFSPSAPLPVQQPFAVLTTQTVTRRTSNWFWLSITPITNTLTNQWPPFTIMPKI